MYPSERGRTWVFKLLFPHSGHEEFYSKQSDAYHEAVNWVQEDNYENYAVIVEGGDDHMQIRCNGVTAEIFKVEVL